MIRRLLQYTVVLALAVGLFVPATFAQTPQDAPEVTDDEIEKVAAILFKIDQLQVEYRKKLRDAVDRDHARSVQTEAG